MDQNMLLNAVFALIVVMQCSYVMSNTTEGEPLFLKTFLILFEVFYRFVKESHIFFIGLILKLQIVSFSVLSDSWWTEMVLESRCYTNKTWQGIETERIHVSLVCS